MPRSVQMCIGGGGWFRPTQPKVPQSVQIYILGGGRESGGWGKGRGGSKPTEPKVPRSVQICIFRGGGVVQANIPEILE